MGSRLGKETESVGDTSLARFECPPRRHPWGRTSSPRRTRAPSVPVPYVLDPLPIPRLGYAGIGVIDDAAASFNRLHSSHHMRRCSGLAPHPIRSLVSRELGKKEYFPGGLTGHGSLLRLRWAVEK
jgi:hypothetical protein